MDMLLAPVFQDFLGVRPQCLAEGGFVVGPMGPFTMIRLLEYAKECGRADPTTPDRFEFDPWLPGVVYESHATGGGGYRYVGLIDEIEINRCGGHYREPKMKPGEGHHGEARTDERMPAFVRFKVLVPVSDVIPGKSQLRQKDLGLTPS